MSLAEDMALNLELSMIDPWTWNKRIDTIPANDGEEMTDEIKEIIDDEDLDILEGVKMDCDGMTAKENSLRINELSEKITNVEARLFDRDGDKGHISSTDEQFCKLSEDIKEGFQTVHAVIKSLDETLQYALKEQNKKIDGHSDELGEIKKIQSNHGLRLDGLEQKKKTKSERIFQWFLAVGSGIILLIAGMIAGGFIGS